MTDYATLKDDVATWSARSDLSTLVPSFIRIAEAAINRKLRVMEMETEVDLTVTSANEYKESLPSGFLGFRSLFNDGNSPRMTYVEPDRFHVIDNETYFPVIRRNTGETLYTIEANKVVVDAAAGATADVTLHAVYFKRLDALSDSNTSNAVLVAHYDVYLYGALAALWNYADDSEQELKYTKLFDAAVADIDAVEHGRRRSAGANIRRPPATRVV
ncbi:MAG: hypothetical protein P8Y47_12280 [Alphaproteobacteria bacterium]